MPFFKNDDAYVKKPMFYHSFALEFVLNEAVCSKSCMLNEHPFANMQQNVKKIEKHYVVYENM